MWCMATLLALSAGFAGAADVQLGAGDVLKISVYGNPDLALETRVSEAGEITFPLVGNVALGGLSVSAAEKKLGGLLESGGFLRKAQVNIIVTQLQSQQVSVLGQVNRPGRYPIEGKRSLMDMLAMAGGVSQDGGDAVNLIRKRNGKTTREIVDIVEMVRSADLNRDLDVAGNDVIFVERAPRFYIYGEVQRPGAFRLERSMTVLQALSVGGGLTQRGTERGIRIKRRDEAGKLEIINAKHDDLLQVDDMVYVQESLF
ncbi:polysaccharide export protein EpsE [Janthinobacterium agaricidamnosum]|uniref:Polysaccharide export protein EpsE n=2 Tax=Janthinobacterium TaxID=29580 RepID=A0A3G2E4Q7_9BURK|nr:polysaccharide export protein EpsE [Janthinobacterium agaricidamnosum]